MKKIITSLFAIGLLCTAYAQTGHKKNPSLGISFILNDFKTAQELRNSGLANVIRSKDWTRSNLMTPGVALSFINGLTEKIDFVGTLSGSFLDYPVPGKQSFGFTKFLLDATAVANLKLLSDKYFFTPYLTAGIGASQFGGYYGAFIPVGAGLQFNLFDESYIIVNSQYRMAVTENVEYHLYHSIGFAGNISKRKVKESAALPVPPVHIALAK